MKLKKTDNKTIEVINYELKSKGKFPKDRDYPAIEQNRQKEISNKSYKKGINKKINSRVKK